MDSIFVGQNDACWRIAGFEDMCSFSEIAKEVCGLCNTREEKFDCSSRDCNTPKRNVRENADFHLESLEIHE
jgi:hypothetical protein